jgi:four helix bundle protein
MAKIISYRDLETWQLAMDLVEACYRLTTSFPDTERYGLTSQLRRAAVSIPCNVAEGSCRKTTRTYANHVSIAIGSHGELETCIEIGSRLGFFRGAAKQSLDALTIPVGKLLNGLHRSLELKLTDV